MKRMVLFGAGKNGCTVLQKVKDVYKEDLLFCDNDVNKIGRNIGGIRTVAFEELVHLYQNGEIEKIIITPYYLDELVCQCKSAEISDSILYYYDLKDNCVRPVREKYADSIYSHDGEEIYLKNRFIGIEKGIYVDVGANHPFRFSNTYWAYSKGWRGINIEPNIRNFELLKQHRKEDINLNCGISDEETQLEYYIFQESALNTFCAEEIENKDDIVETCMVPVKRLDSIFREHAIKNIEYMDIDVEGMEMQVLNSINWDEVCISCILVEQRGMTLVDVTASEVCTFLKDKGYLPVSKYNRTVIYERMT